MCSHTALFCCFNCSQTLICLELKCSVWQCVLPGEEKQYVRRRRRKSSVKLVFIENRFGASNHAQRQGFQCRDVHLCSECELVYMPIKYLLMVVTLHNWVNAEKTVRLNFHAMQCICAMQMKSVDQKPSNLSAEALTSVRHCQRSDQTSTQK